MRSRLTGSQFFVKLIRTYPGSLEAMLRASFFDSRPYDLPPHVRVKIIIDSRFDGARYFLDNRLNLRYVLSEEVDEIGCRRLITVEQPKINMAI